MQNSKKLKDKNIYTRLWSEGNTNPPRPSEHISTDKRAVQWDTYIIKQIH